MAGVEPSNRVPLLPTAPEGHSAVIPKEKKTSRGESSIGACDACRLRKVRCLANESSTSSKCQRCARANRECVYTTHSKTRRRKRTDTRVKELEEKVRGLSMLLENGKGGANKSSAESNVKEMEDEEEARTCASKEAPNSGHADDMLYPWKDMVNLSGTQSSGSAMPEWDQLNGETHSVLMAPDVVDRKFLTMDKATYLVKRYIDHLMPLYPAVPLSCTAAELRRDKPILFLAVLAASVEASDSALNLRLNRELQRLYAKKVIEEGHKSLEFIQALIISVMWTYPPERSQELKFHQQIHMAATMAMDIGLARRSKGPVYVNLEPFKPMSSSEISVARNRLPENTTLEDRRALLACYVNCASVSMSLRLPNMLRFTSWMADCLDSLETSLEAVPTDKSFAAWVRLQRIVEDCGISLGLDNPDNAVSLDEDRAQFTLKGTEKQMMAWKKQVDLEDGLVNLPFLEITYHVNNLYVHEIALHADYDVEEFRPPYTLTTTCPSRKKLSPPYVSAIMVCLGSSHSVLNTFLKMGVHTARVSPTLVWVRVMYAVVILMKLSASARAPSGELGQVLDPGDCRVLEFTEKLLAYMDAVATIGDEKKHILAIKFRNMLNNLKHWFEALSLQLDAQTKQSDHMTPESATETRLRCDGPLNMASAPRSSSASMAPDFGTSAQDDNSTIYSPASSAIVNAYNGKAPQLIQTPTYSDASQPSLEHQGSDFGLFDFPMEVDPNMLSQLVGTELYQNSGGNVMLGGENGTEWMDVPEIDWTSWPPQ